MVMTAQDFAHAVPLTEAVCVCGRPYVPLGVTDTPRHGRAECESPPCRQGL